jgi:hypothetical protein
LARRADYRLGLSRSWPSKPPKATTKPYTRHILGIDSGVQSHPKATLMRPSCDPHATLMPGICDLQARRLGSAPLDYPCVTVALPLFYRCFIGVSPSFIPCAARAIPWGFRQDHGVSTKTMPILDSTGLAVIQINSRLSTHLERIWILPPGAVVPNPKPEIRNPKQIQMPNGPRLKTASRVVVWVIPCLVLGVCFGLRVSDFRFPRSEWR